MTYTLNIKSPAMYCRARGFLLLSMCGAQRTNWVGLDFDFLVASAAERVVGKILITKFHCRRLRFGHPCIHILIGRVGIMVSNPKSFDTRTMSQQRAVFRRCMPEASRAFLIDTLSVLPVSNEEIRPET